VPRSDGSLAEGGGQRRKRRTRGVKEGRKEGRKEGAPLLKPRDPHLARGEI